MCTDGVLPPPPPPQEAPAFQIPPRLACRRSAAALCFLCRPVQATERGRAAPTQVAASIASRDPAAARERLRSLDPVGTAMRHF